MWCSAIQLLLKSTKLALRERKLYYIQEQNMFSGVPPNNQKVTCYRYTNSRDSTPFLGWSDMEFVWSVGMAANI